VRQLLAESVILSVLGGAAGVLLAWWGLRSMIAAAPDIPRLESIGLDFTVVGFALLATFATGLMFGLAPAVHIAGADVAGWLRERGTGGRVGARRLRGVLVVAQVALSLMLLIGAGLLVRSLANRMSVGVGFDVDGLLSAEIQVPSRRYETPEAQAVFFEQLVERVNGLSGVRQASAITFPPLSGGGTRTNIWPMDQPAPEAGQSPGADIRWVHHGYHGTMGIPLLAGRYFDERDRAGTPLAVLVNETGARQLWPGADAVGKRIAMPWGDTMRAEVIGVVADIRSDGPDTEPYPMLYWDHRQFRNFEQMTLVVRTDRAPSELLPSVRAVVRELDPELPLYNVATMDDLFAKSMARARFTTASMGLFALLALILAGIGTYAVMAYSTQQRTQEIGIRIALGANRASVTRMVVGQGMIQIAIAVAIGTAGALFLSRTLQGLVFGVTTTDPLTFAAMAMLLGLTGVLAAWLPARRASGIDPVSAIRAE
jgi:putative ABC transport system permease protein